VRKSPLFAVKPPTEPGLRRLRELLEGYAAIVIGDSADEPLVVSRLHTLRAGLAGNGQIRWIPSGSPRRQVEREGRLTTARQPPGRNHYLDPRRLAQLRCRIVRRFCRQLIYGIHIRGSPTLPPYANDLAFCVAAVSQRQPVRGTCFTIQPDLVGTATSIMSVPTSTGSAGCGAGSGVIQGAMGKFAYWRVLVRSLGGARPGAGFRSPAAAAAAPATRG
jgi:hypothetical protein